MLRKFLLILPLLLVLSALLLILLTYDSMPERIPTHWGFSGTADAWGNKSYVWMPWGVMTGIALLQYVLSYVAERRLRRGERRISPQPLPDKDLQRLRLEARLMLWLNPSCTLLMGMIVPLTIYNCQHIGWIFGGALILFHILLFSLLLPLLRLSVGLRSKPEIE